MKIKNTFVQGKMNKDIDERLLPKGEYPHAENIRLANTESSDMGAIENVEGNEKITNFNLTNAKTIGAFSDGSNQKMYWFTTSDEKDMLVEYNLVNNETSVVLESSKPNSVLGLDKSYLITGVSKIINGDSDKDLLAWTDGLNPPRMINIERAKTYGLDGFEAEDINLIKKPPRFAPKTNLTFTNSTLENNIEDKFLSFSYRYKYLDGEYSALSSFSNYNFAPNQFRLDYQTMENEGMKNSFNAVEIVFDTGSKRVSEIQLVYKESNSNALSIIETFNKKDEGWGDNVEKSYVFANSKRYTFLPEDELFRAYDNVPISAKSMEMAGNRLVFGNYVEGYDLVNKFGQNVVVDYDLSLLSKDLSGEELSRNFSTVSASNDTLIINTVGVDLNYDNRILLDLELKGFTDPTSSFSGDFNFILNRDYTSANDLAQDEDFIFFIESVLTGVFESNYSATPPTNGTLVSVTPFKILSSGTNYISIKTPELVYSIDDGTNPVTQETYEWSFATETKIYHRKVAINTSLKTNRSYEVGIIYLDEYNRASTVLTCADNTLYVPQGVCINQNKIVTSIKNTAPKWADRYKLVVKQNKFEYDTVYVNVFYEEGLYKWVKLEGASVNKVKEGDTLIVKSDLGGYLEKPVKTRVLEVSTKQPDFIEGNEDVDSKLIVEEAGLYMKIKPSGFDMRFDASEAKTFEGSSHLRYPKRTRTEPALGEVVNTVFEPIPITSGSTVRLFIEFEGRGSITYKATYDKTFKVAGDYTSVEQWFNAEVGDLGSFGRDYTWDGQTDIWNDTIPEGYGQAGVNNIVSGYGFQDGKFYVVPHRKGTATRKITSTVRFDIRFTEGIVIFETSPEESDNNIYYETEQTFEIQDGNHLGNIQNQSDQNSTAIVEMDFFNSYTQGNGAESYKIRDTFNGKYLNIDLRPTTTSIEGYSKVDRYADLTYSSPYNENSSLNGLNEFNLSLANYKEDIDKKYGSIQKLFSRDTDLLVFQEDKVSKVLFGKDLLMNADGTSNVSRIEDVLGQQIAFKGEYGISRNPESFTFDGFNIYFTDSKRGAVIRLGNNGVNKISDFGLRTFFRDTFKNSIDNKKIGGFDPHNNQYVIHPVRESLIVPVFMKCGSQVTKSDLIGDVPITIDFGVKTGLATFNYSSNGVPVRYNLEWSGQTFTTGFVGDASYNTNLNDLGLPSVSGAGTGTFSFNKTTNTPTDIKVTVESPLCDSRFTLGSDCIVTPELEVVSVILNDVSDVDLSITSRYQWSTPTYSSPLKTYNTVFTQGEVELFESSIGQEGENNIPTDGSTIKVESFSGYKQTGSFNSKNRLRYLASNTLYTSSDIEALRTASSSLVIDTITYTNGDELDKGEFVFNRPNNEKYLYIIWDYKDENNTELRGVDPSCETVATNTEMRGLDAYCETN